MARKLLLKDVGAMALIIGKMDIKDQMTEFVKGLNEGKSQEALGVDLIFTLINGASKKGVLNDLYDFIGSILEIPGTEAANLPVDELMTKLKEAADVESWINFFTHAAKSMLTK